MNSSSTGEDPDGGTRSSPEATGEFPYATAAAFRTALKVKFTEITKHDPRFSAAELQRQFAYDRILSRCFSADDADRWILKGAGALLARLPVARHSKDIDLYYAERTAAPDAAVAALARAADREATSAGGAGLGTSAGRDACCLSRSFDELRKAERGALRDHNRAQFAGHTRSRRSMSSTY